MKIGILTFHFCGNFGAVLQCASLQKTIRELGHEAEVIDYQPTQKEVGFAKMAAKKAHQAFCTLRFGHTMNGRFECFRKENIVRSAVCWNMEELAGIINDYDAVIVGSDQVWNRSYPFVTLAYFLDESLGFKGRKISYAACCGHKDMPQEEMSRIRDDLLRFDHLSVRNQVTFEWVNELTGLTPQIVCDPSLFQDLSSASAARKIPYERYILISVLGAPIQGGVEAAIQEIREKHGNLPAVVVPTQSFRFQKFPFADHVFWEAGPQDWIQLVKKASFVLTDSFHAAMYCMKYQRPFLAYYSEAIRAQRLLDTAQRFSAMDAIAESVEDAVARGCFKRDLDFDPIQKNMRALMEPSVQFLTQALI